MNTYLFKGIAYLVSPATVGMPHGRSVLFVMAPANAKKRGQKIEATR